MPKPKSKEELLQASQTNYQKLLELIDAYPEEDRQREFPPGSLNRNIRDVLAHLHYWHQLLLGWYEQGMQGKKPDMPATGYTWRATPRLNKKIWEGCQNTSLAEVRKQLDHSYEQVQQVIHKHSDEELFEKKRYKWTGTTSIGAYLISNTSSHYDWALRLIKKSMN